VRFRYRTDLPPREAAVLVPLCQVSGVPSILFTLRTSHLNSHRGEISFPGGKADPEDGSPERTATREAEEEIGVNAGSIRILGHLPPLPNKTLSIKVSPVVGVLPAMNDLSGLVPNPSEVAHIFSLPLSQLLDPERCHMVRFRETGPWVAQWRVEDHVAGVEIWGLTAYILTRFL
ncbi:NUDIX hydrolase domain-like protein, partial [Piptocephalis cylindrospora]